jgi:hypothetical protein
LPLIGDPERQPVNPLPLALGMVLVAEPVLFVVAEEAAPGVVVPEFWFEVDELAVAPLVPDEACPAAPVEGVVA